MKNKTNLLMIRSSTFANEVRFVLKYFNIYLFFSILSYPNVLVQAASLTAAEINSSTLNCLFANDCVPTTYQTTADLLIVHGGGIDGTLTTRLILPKNAAGKPTQGLYGYEYQIHMSNLADVCITAFRVPFSQITPVDYDGNGTKEDFYLITQGGIGSVKPDHVEREGGDTLFFDFSGTHQICTNKDTFAFGVVSSASPEASLASTDQLWVEVDVTYQPSFPIVSGQGSQATLIVTKKGEGNVTGTGIDCGNDCDDLYSINTSVTLTATPAIGFSFVEWKDDCTGTSPTTTVTMNQVKHCEAVFTQASLLKLTINKTGEGNITSSDSKINCGNDCEETYSPGTSVILTATPALNAQFINWNGHCTGTSPTVTVMVDTTKNCGVVFTTISIFPDIGTQESTPSADETTNPHESFSSPSGSSYSLPPTSSLRVSIEGGGEVSILSGSEPIHCTSNKEFCEIYPQTGTSITLIPTPAPGFYFSSWGGHEECVDNQVQMLGSLRCVAYFRKLSVLTVNKIGPGEGTIMAQGIECGTDCAESYAIDTPVTLIAIPASNSMFTTWQGNCDETGHVVMNTHKSCQAEFMLRSSSRSDDPSQEVLSVVPQPPVEEVTRSSEQELPSSIVCHPADDSVASATNQQTQSIPQVTLEVAKEGEGEIQSDPMGVVCGANCTKDYLPGTSVILIASPANRFIFTGWSGDCQGSNIVTTVLMNTPRRCVAHFSRAPLIEPIEKRLCPPEEMLDWICNAHGQTLKQELEIRSWGNLSNAVVPFRIDSRGWASNLIVQASGEVNGGTLTGYIKNAGVLKDFEFRGAAIFGGTLAGEIVNNSEVGGYFQDVSLAADTHLSGGRLKGRIIGKADAPARLDHLIIMTGSHLSGVELGDEVTVQTGVRIDSVQKATLVE